MPLIRPFAALRPAPGQAHAIIAPPYDVVSTEEARSLAAGKPRSFLHVSRPEIDLPPGADSHSPAAYAKAAENFLALQREGALVRDPQPCYYVYRMEAGGHVQTGLAAAASVAEYNTNRIRKHEFTRPDKEDDRVHHMEAVNAQTGPALLAYPAAPKVDALLQSLAIGEAAIDATLAGVRHQVWVVADASAIAEITALFEAMPALYIADGHHRSAAASRVAKSRGAGEHHFLTVIFPHHEMKILDYNRLIKDLGGMSEVTLLEKLRERCSVEPSAGPVHPKQSGEFGLYLNQRWHRLQIDTARIPADPVGSLDVSLLHDHLIAPLLGITDPRRDTRIDFVGGIRGLGELERRVDSGEMALAFSLRPTPIESLFAVADAGNVMPPKSTWFEPKLADGLLSNVLD